MAAAVRSRVRLGLDRQGPAGRWVGIKINPQRRGVPGEYSLPLYMKGNKAPRRHPVFGGIRWGGHYSDL